MVSFNRTYLVNFFGILACENCIFSTFLLKYNVVLSEILPDLKKGNLFFRRKKLIVFISRELFQTNMTTHNKRICVFRQLSIPLDE